MIIESLAVFLGVFGLILNCFGRIQQSYFVWIFSNSLMIYIHKGDLELVLWISYFLITAFGLIRGLEIEWRK